MCVDMCISVCYMEDVRLLYTDVVVLRSIAFEAYYDLNEIIAIKCEKCARKSLIIVE